MRDLLKSRREDLASQSEGRDTIAQELQLVSAESALPLPKSAKTTAKIAQPKCQNTTRRTPRPRTYQPPLERNCVALSPNAANFLSRGDPPSAPTASTTPPGERSRTRRRTSCSSSWRGDWEGVERDLSSAEESVSEGRGGRRGETHRFRRRWSLWEYDDASSLVLRSCWCRPSRVA